MATVMTDFLFSWWCSLDCLQIKKWHVNWNV